MPSRARRLCCGDMQRVFMRAFISFCLLGRLGVLVPLYPRLHCPVWHLTLCCFQPLGDCAPEFFASFCFLMQALCFVDYDAITAFASCADFMPICPVAIAMGIQDLDILLCYVVMLVFPGCLKFQIYPGLKNSTLRLLLVLGATASRCVLATLSSDASLSIFLCVGPCRNLNDSSLKKQPVEQVLMKKVSHVCAVVPSD